jgi:hypothetical protein
MFCIYFLVSPMLTNFDVGKIERPRVVGEASTVHKFPKFDLLEFHYSLFLFVCKN